MTSGLPWRQRAAIALCSFVMRRGGGVFMALIGLRHVDVNTCRRFFQAFITTLSGQMPADDSGAARNGLAREAGQLRQMFSQLQSQMHPGSWVFHEESVEGGKVRIMVLPRTIDSNTGVVLQSDEPRVLAGDIITVDGEPSNCDKAALNFVLRGPGVSTAP